MSEETSIIVPNTVQPAEAEAEATPHQSNLLREIIETALLTAIIFLIVNVVIGRFRIEQVSMQPTLHEGEYVIVEKVSYLLHPPERGDIIVFKHPGEDLIKRVIGLPGDTLEIQGGRVHINGSVLTEPYLTEPIRSTLPAQKIEAGRYFVMGDNRNNSSDSRAFGAIPAGDIIGRAAIIYWPPPNWQIMPSYSYAAAVSP